MDMMFSGMQIEQKMSQLSVFVMGIRTLTNEVHLLSTFYLFTYFDDYFPHGCPSIKNCFKSLKPSFHQLEISGCTMNISSLNEIVQLLQPSELYFTPIYIYTASSRNFTRIYRALKSITSLDIRDGPFEAWNSLGDYITMERTQDSLVIHDPTIPTHFIQGLLNEMVDLQSLYIDVWENMEEIISYFPNALPSVKSLHVGQRNITSALIECVTVKMPTLQNISVSISQYLHSNVSCETHKGFLQHVKDFSIKIIPLFTSLYVDTKLVISEYSNLLMPSLTHLHIFYHSQQWESTVLTAETMGNMNINMPNLEELYIHITYMHLRGFIDLKDLPWKQINFDVYFDVILKPGMSLVLYMDIMCMNQENFHFKLEYPAWARTGNEATITLRLRDSGLQNLHTH